MLCDICSKVGDCCKIVSNRCKDFRAKDSISLDDIKIEDTVYLIKYIPFGSGKYVIYRCETIEHYFRDGLIESDVYKLNDESLFGKVLLDNNMLLFRTKEEAKKAIRELRKENYHVV